MLANITIFDKKTIKHIKYFITERQNIVNHIFFCRLSITENVQINPLL